MVFVLGIINIIYRLWMRFDDDSALLGAGVGIVAGCWLWLLVLRSVWRARRAYLQRSGTEVMAAVVDSSYRRLTKVGFDQHRTRIEVAFVHPDSGADHRLRKDYVYSELGRAHATALHERFPEGAAMPLRVRRKSAVFDVPERPSWADIW